MQKRRALQRSINLVRIAAMRHIPSISGSRLPVLSSESGLATYLRKIFAIPLLSENEEYRLAVSWHDHQDQEAAQRLVLAHLRLVPKIAARYKDYGLSFMDIVAEGNIGLMQAVRQFNPRRGFRLVTYALWWIRASIQEYVLRSWSLVKIATSGLQKRLFFKLRSLKARIGAFDQTLSDEHAALLASELGTNKDEVCAFNTRLLGDLSLNKPMDGGASGDKDAKTFQDGLVSEDANPEDMALAKQEQQFLRGRLARALKCLSKRERFILWARRLVDDIHTLEQLSQRFGISRERVRQLENQTFKKLKKLCHPEKGLGVGC